MNNNPVLARLARITAGEIGIIRSQVRMNKAIITTKSFSGTNAEAAELVAEFDANRKGSTLNARSAWTSGSGQITI